MLPSAFKIICAATLIWCDAPPLSPQSSLLDVQETMQEDEVDFSTNIDAYSEQSWVSIPYLAEIFVSEDAWRTQNLSSEGKGWQSLTDKRFVPTCRSSLKLSIQVLGECRAALHRTHFRAARGVGMKSKKWTPEKTFCAHLSVVSRIYVPRPLEVSAGGPRLLESAASS